MAIYTFHPVDVMPAVSRPERRVHLLDIQSAIRHLWMARRAGRSGLLFVPRMAGHTADAFMHADWGPVVAAGNLHRGDGRLALVAERLPLIAAHMNGARAL
jgi:hypothetical protein